jgi:cytochrome c553
MKETTMKKRLVSLSGTILLGLGMSAVHAEDADGALNRIAAERVAVGTCATCHGPRGHSFSPKFPVLAGQHANYLVAQLQAFKAQTRGDPDALGYMWGMAAPLSDQLMASLADYYSRQTPIAGPSGAAALIARGQDIYQKGDAVAGVPPCGACHGPAAAGTDAFPRLAGQHVQYLIKQLRSFQNNMRNVAVMHGVARGLQLNDIEAVATYLQSLGP